MLKHKYNFSHLLCSVKLSTPKHAFPTTVYTFSQEVSNWLVKHTAE